MIRHEILENEGVVVVEPSGPLSVEDFEKLAADVDAYLEKNDKLNGLVIHAHKFPGWENFAGFTHHMRFIRDHHRRIGRIALASDNRAALIAPKIAKHFVSAEVKHFDYQDLAAALAWVKHSE